MYKSDPILKEIIDQLFDKDSPFQCLPAQIAPEATATQESLRVGFNSLLCCPEAREVNNAVFLWVLEKPYQHQDGKHELSTVIRIEKTVNSIQQRWNRYIENLVTDYGNNININHDNYLRSLADNDQNLSFFREIISKYGPLKIWWASLEDLNQSSTKNSFDNPQQWEKLICQTYVKHHRCYPLKDRKCG